MLPRLEPAVVAGLTAHAGVVWASSDPGVWIWSGTGILGMLGLLAIAGLARPQGQWWALVRGGLALSVLLLVGQLTGAVPGPLEVWFGLLAFVYPLVLPANRSPGGAPGGGRRLLRGSASSPLRRWRCRRRRSVPW